VDFEAQGLTQVASLALDAVGGVSSEIAARCLCAGGEHNG
jgi:hypothetical protein